MSLRQKTLLLTSVIVVVLITTLYGVSRFILLDSYAQLEQQSVEQNVQRVLNALADDITNLRKMALDWSEWDLTYRFIQDNNRDYLHSNIVASTFVAYNINFLLLIDPSNFMVLGRAYDPVMARLMPLSLGFKEHLSAKGLSLNQIYTGDTVNQDGIAGLLLLPEGPALVAAAPILPTNLQGEPKGIFIWGRYLNRHELDHLAEKTRLSINIYHLDRTLPPDIEAVSQAFSNEHPIIVVPQTDQTVAGYALIQDITSSPGLLLRVEMPRAIYIQGETSVSYFMGALVLVSLIFTGVTLLLLERLVLARVAYLHSRVQQIRSSSDLAADITINGSDELAQLATSINDMLASLAHSDAKLRQAHAEALEALRFKAQILSSVSHDARTPLSVITLRVGMLQRGHYGTLNPQQDQALNLILDSTRQLLHFINNLLNQAQLEAHRIQLKREAFAPADLLTDVQTSLLPLVERKGLQLLTDLCAELPSVLVGDRDRLDQILFNLVNNAIQFTEQGQISVRLCREDANHWSLQVADTGVGISPEAQHHIFEAFWQAEPGQATKLDSGVGLGLSIVKQLTDLMGGHITLHSAVGAGSLFIVTLPLECDPSAVAQATAG